MKPTFKGMAAATLGAVLVLPAMAPVAKAQLVWAEADAVYSICKHQVRQSERDCKAATRAAGLTGRVRLRASRVCTKRARNELKVCKTRAAIRSSSSASGFSAILAGGAAPSGTAMVTTDQLDYHPLETVTVAGVGWLPGETVSMVITEEPQTHDPVSLSSIADDNGDFINTDYTVRDSDAGVIFTLTAAGEQSGVVAQTVFTDEIAPGALASPCSSSACQYNPTHWEAQAGTTITDTIQGATDLPCTGPNGRPNTQTCGDGFVDVFIKSSDFGNTTVCGSVSGTTITFSWPVPASGVCNTTIVAYCQEGNDTNDGLLPGPAQAGHTKGQSAAGFAIVDSAGSLITSCAAATPTPTPTPGLEEPPPGKLTACKYEDDNANGANDGEPALAGWALTIDPVDGAPEGATQITDDTGCVTWTNLSAGSYAVTESAPAGGNPWFNTDPGSSGPCLIDPSGCPSPSKTTPVALGQTSTVAFGNIQSGKINVCKYEDLNANGANDGEPALSGWTVAVGGASSGMGVTDASGCASFFVLPIGSYVAGELLQLGPPAWFNTDPGLNGSPCLPSDCPIPTKSGTSVAAGSSTEVDFGNLQSAEKHGQKFYDVNTDGRNNDSQVVAGIKITLTGTDLRGTTVGPLVTYTDSLGNYAFTNLLPSCSTPPCSETGYTVTETIPNATWHNTTPTSITFGLDPGEVETGNNFGNACVGAGNGLTLGFWSNKNGWFGMKNGSGGMSGALLFLDGLNLRDALGSPQPNGSNFDPTCYCAKGACPAGVNNDCTGGQVFRSWLLNANANNMAYMLSAQLAAMELNVRNGGNTACSAAGAPFACCTGLGTGSCTAVSGSTSVYAGTAPANCTVPGLSSYGFITINDLMNAANSASNFNLASFGLTVASGDARNCQNFMQVALNSANNNLTFVQPRPCSF
jgi:hypothetical protein